ncbi:MAG: siroheme synthase CysG [Burkholderiaceae bacterium]|jgi:uroporphyrin-III C-methyltransferase/precorrin-2 dehydrogenase/sirohydrochlorin ferrochelatase|nr:siroheme synthase CysG [Burkholderiaceae bacterium]
MDYLPIFLDIAGQPCAVIGGGEVAARKVSLLREAGAQVTVTAPDLCEPLAALLSEGKIEHRAGVFTPEALKDAALVIAATDDRSVNAEVSQLARAQRLPVNVVDDPELCSFILPAIVDRSPVVVAVSTGGASPVLARLLRARLESLVPATYGQLADLARRFRDRARRALPQPARRPFWERVFQGPVAELVFSGRLTEAERALERMLEDSATRGPEPGEVYLVGAGPGNPDLLTFAALRLMQQADVVLHDNLVSPEILELTRRDAERIYVGKQRAHHTMRQEEINALMVRLAHSGRRVLRLKGGDPYVFGRGGEEIESLAASGVRFQVVPGVTAACGVAAYAGIPLTHRDYAQSCVLVTGHLKDGSMNLDWHGLARPRQTVVVYMGLLGLDALCEQLIAHGMPRDMPAAVVQQATRPQQRVVTASLEDLPRRVAEAGLRPPTLVIVGDVVRLREKLSWFEPAADIAPSTATATKEGTDAASEA